MSTWKAAKECSSPELIEVSDDDNKLVSTLGSFDYLIEHLQIVTLNDN